VRRLATLAALLYASSAALPAAASPDPLAKYSVVSIEPAVANLIIATVSMTFQPFVRHKSVYASTYAARVFPYFLFNEKGRIWIDLPDDVLARADRGQPVDFVGHALSDSGDERRVDGHATPTGPRTGKIHVRVFVTRRISLSYDTTYRLTGGAPRPVAVTAR
jgi:hypothetical protein